MWNPMLIKKKIFYTYNLNYRSHMARSHWKDIDNPSLMFQNLIFEGSTSRLLIPINQWIYKKIPYSMYIWMFWSSTSFQKFFCCIIVPTWYSMPNYRLKCALFKGIFNPYSYVKDCNWVCDIILKFYLLAKWWHFIMKISKKILEIFREINPFRICQLIFQFIFYHTYF